MRHSGVGSTMRALRLQDHRTWGRGEQWPYILLRQLCPGKRRNQIARPQLTASFRRGSSKSQNPSSRESPIINLQTGMFPGVVTWSLGFGASLEFGDWNLEI